MFFHIFCADFCRMAITFLVAKWTLIMDDNNGLFISVELSLFYNIFRYSMYSSKF